MGPELASMSADVTVFAPSAAAFAAVPEEAQRQLMEETDPGVLTQVLLCFYCLCYIPLLCALIVLTF